jgi:hypothetical protein
MAWQEREWNIQAGRNEDYNTSSSLVIMGKMYATRTKCILKPNAASKDAVAIRAQLLKTFGRALARGQ